MLRLKLTSSFESKHSSYNNTWRQEQWKSPSKALNYSSDIPYGRHFMCETCGNKVKIADAFISGDQVFCSNCGTVYVLFPDGAYKSLNNLKSSSKISKKVAKEISKLEDILKNNLGINLEKEYGEDNYVVYSSPNTYHASSRVLRHYQNEEDIQDDWDNIIKRYSGRLDQIRTTLQSYGYKVQDVAIGYDDKGGIYFYISVRK